MFEIHKIYLGPAVRMGVVLGFGLGIVAFVVWMIFLIAIGEMGFDFYYYDYDEETLSFLFGLPLIFSGGGALFALIAVPAYNLMADLFGGFDIDLRKTTHSKPQSSAHAGAQSPQAQ